MVSVSSFDSSKILDVDILTKYCNFCAVNKGKPLPNFCNINYEGSSGAMKVETTSIFASSEMSRNFKYKTMARMA